MSWIFAKLGFSQAVGLHWDAQSVYVSRVLATPFGPREQERFAVPLLSGEMPSDGVRRAIGQLADRRGGLRAVVGLPADQTYLATRAVSSGLGAASPRSLLRESLRSASLCVDKMLADVRTFRPDRRDVVSIVACPRDTMAAMAAAVSEQQLRFIRAEPEPCALLRLVEARFGRAKKDSVVVRVLLDKARALAVLTASDRPIAWRTAPLVPGDEASGILTLVRSLATIAPPCGVERPVDLVAVHGRAELERLIDADWLRQQLAIPLHWHDGPEFRGEQIAHGLALSGLDEVPAAFDLAGDFRRVPGFGEIFPWRELALYAAVLVLFAGFLWHRKDQFDDACTLALRQNSSSTHASKSRDELMREKKELQNQVSAVQQFVGSRVIWTRLARELSRCLPDTVFLTSLSGEAELERPGKRKQEAKRSLIIRGAVSVPQSGLIPHEVDRLIDTVRRNPQITGEFPVVELAELKQYQDVRDDRQLAIFTLLCVPKNRNSRK
jgi:hypothetical protein